MIGAGLRLFATPVGQFAVIRTIHERILTPEENGMPFRISPLVLAILCFVSFSSCEKQTEVQQDDQTAETDQQPETSDDESELTEEQKAIQKIFLQAGKDFEAGRVDDAIAQIKKAQAAAPDDLNVQMAAAVSMTQISSTLGGDELESAKSLVASVEEIIEELNSDETIQANTEPLVTRLTFEKARITAEEGQTEKALDLLEESMKRGFQQLALVEGMKAFDAVRETERYNELAKTAGLRGFPFDFTLPSALDDSTISLKDHAGKVVIVDIWGTWCPPCRAEVPHFVDLQFKYEDQGLQVIGINYEQMPKDEWKPHIQKFADAYNVNYLLALGDDATQDKVPDLEFFPTTLFIDREGEVRLKLVGGASFEKLDSIVKNLIDEKKPDNATPKESAETPAKADGPAVAED